jgi:hypothetical protein
MDEFVEMSNIVCRDDRDRDAEFADHVVTGKCFDGNEQTSGEFSSFFGRIINQRDESRFAWTQLKRNRSNTQAFA